MKLYSLLILFFAYPFHVFAAEYGLGLAFDNSSNMLLRPDGPSGTIASVYGGAGFERGPFQFLYNAEAGMVERYDGVQFHSHMIDVSTGGHIGSGDRPAEVTVRTRAAITRLGEVSFLGGYNDYRFSGTLKVYLGESSLFRGETGVLHRGFRSMTVETYDQAETFVQFDRFFDTGTTLRGRIDGGIRRYGEIHDTPVTTMMDVRARVAQSLGAKTGVWLELHNRFVGNESSPDSSSRSERRLFEDAYKSSAFGGTVHFTRMLKNKGSVQLHLSIERKRFGHNLAKQYPYLPLDGWNETEGNYSVSYSPRPDFLPNVLQPTFKIYHMRVDTSVSGFPYHSTGMMIEFAIL